MVLLPIRNRLLCQTDSDRIDDAVYGGNVETSDQKLRMFFIEGWNLDIDCSIKHKIEIEKATTGRDFRKNVAGNIFPGVVIGVKKRLNHESCKALILQLMSVLRSPASL